MRKVANLFFCTAKVEFVAAISWLWITLKVQIMGKLIYLKTKNQNFVGKLRILVKKLLLHGKIGQS